MKPGNNNIALRNKNTAYLTLSPLLRFQNVFRPTRKREAGVFNFPLFQERFEREAQILCRMSVDE